jgi:hypothetical protein
MQLVDLGVILFVHGIPRPLLSMIVREELLRCNVRDGFEILELSHHVSEGLSSRMD